jgi:exodeoxyribonuclease VII large subunit
MLWEKASVMPWTPNYSDNIRIMPTSLLHPFADDEPAVFSVSELTARIRSLLETSFRQVWVRGEISNLRVPASGHIYFTLKDEQSQIRAVFFKGHHRSLRFEPESGLAVLCQGRVSVYEPRGEYQIIVETMEPQGLGALQLAFEQLKKKLDAEGLFDPARKKALPRCPRRVAVITSRTGAAFHDILIILGRSSVPLDVSLFPVRVQGVEAAAEITAAIEAVNDLRETHNWDLVVVGRGGGSIEDLWPFNEEIVARALARCQVPTISAVGHEIDFTISDLVADLRAPTPTAAAEWVVARTEAFERDLMQWRDRLVQSARTTVERGAQRLRLLEKGIVDPRRRLEDLRLLLDDRLDRIQLAWTRRIQNTHVLQGHLMERLAYLHPGRKIQQHRAALNQELSALSLHYRQILGTHRLALQREVSKLEALNPLAVLSRGYSISYLMPDGRIIRKFTEARPGDPVRIRLWKGFLDCTVEKAEADPASDS